MSVPADPSSEEKRTEEIAKPPLISGYSLPFQNMLAPSLLRVPAPLPLGSPELDVEMREVQALRGVLSKERREIIESWDSEAVVRWNKLARDLVAQHGLDPLTATRVYGLLSIAQYNALQAATENQLHYNRQMPPSTVSGLDPLVSASAPGTYPSEHAALAAASSAVLAAFFPSVQTIDQFRSEEGESRLWAGVNCRTDIIAGESLGRQIAEAILKQSQQEIDAMQLLTIENVTAKDPDKWHVDNDSLYLPAEPTWGTLDPWLMERPDQFRAPPPPAIDSPEFKTALKEVRDISDHRTAEQLKIAKFWGDGQWTVTPPGHWNQIAADLITKKHQSQYEAARTFAYLNMALYDAGIAAWDTKYSYWVIRPWQADTNIKIALKNKPNHPSYVSGHSTFSAAAATFLAAVFPEEAEILEAQAQEASLSRIYASIHYRFDSVEGLKMGNSIGALAVVRWKQ